VSNRDDVVYEFEAGHRTIRASVSEFRGATYLDLRIWYEPEPGQPLRPTQKGVSVSAEYLDELQEAVNALAGAVARTGRSAVATARSSRT